MNQAISDRRDRLELLQCGEIEVLGRIPWSSNATFLVELRLGELEGRGVYKPGSGERPLWDFPGGLFRREVAAYELSVFTELDVVPETVMRTDAPMGSGSIQRFIDADFKEHYFTLMEKGGYEEALRVIAGFDLLANNADRKGGHILVDADDLLWGIDNGLCFHDETKLRTVMWDFAGDELPERIVSACEEVVRELPPSVTSLLEHHETAALVERAEHYLEHRRYPYPLEDHRAYPWPLV